MRLMSIFYNISVGNGLNESENPFLADLTSKNWQKLPSLEPYASYMGLAKYDIKFDFVQLHPVA